MLLSDWKRGSGTDASMWRYRRLQVPKEDDWQRYEWGHAILWTMTCYVVDFELLRKGAWYVREDDEMLRDGWYCWDHHIQRWADAMQRWYLKCAVMVSEGINDLTTEIILPQMGVEVEMVLGKWRLVRKMWSYVKATLKWVWAYLDDRDQLVQGHNWLHSFQMGFEMLTKFNRCLSDAPVTRSIYPLETSWTGNCAPDCMSSTNSTSI